MYEKALAITERMINAQPAFASPIQIYLVFGLKGLGATQQAVGQTADAVASWRRAVASDERARSSNGETLYYLAGCHARLGGIAGTRDPGCRPSKARPSSTGRWVCCAGRSPGVTASQVG